MKEEVTRQLIDVLEKENPGKLPDEARREAESVMQYYEQIKQAEMQASYDLSNEVL